MDVDFLRGATTGGAIGLALAGLVVLGVVRSLVSKIISLALIAALVGGVLYYRTTLEHCLKTCSCKIVTTRIPITGHGCAARR
jgi:hypothetical protein